LAQPNREPHRRSGRLFGEVKRVRARSGVQGGEEKSVRGQLGNNQSDAGLDRTGTPLAEI